MPFVLDNQGVLHDKSRLNSAIGLYLSGLDSQINLLQDHQRWAQDVEAQALDQVKMDTLERRKQTARASCNANVAGKEYDTGQEAFDSQQSEIQLKETLELDQEVSIQHFCSVCMPDTSWEVVVAQ